MPSDRSVWPHLAEPADIIQWADRLPARDELPVLIRRLIRADNDRVTKLDMRGHEGVVAPGYDGDVHAQVATPFVPEGKSVWEMGTNKRMDRKAETEYQKRTGNPQSIVMRDTTFVFVTPRFWPGKDAWVATKSGGPWKAVIAHDIDSICTALERAFELHYWFTGAIGHLAAGVQNLEDWWMNFSTSKSSTLKWPSILEGREESANELLAAINGRKRNVTLRIESIDELLAFFYAAIKSQTLDEQDLHFSRSLIVKDAEAIRFSKLSKEHLAIVPFEEHLYREAKDLGRHSVILIEHGERPVDIDLPIRRVTTGVTPDSVGDKFSMPVAEEVGSALTDPRSHDELVAEQVARALVMLGTFDSWTIRALWLLGTWNLSRSGDKSLLEHLLSKTWAELHEDLEHANDAQYPTFLRIGDTWTVKDIDESWFYMKSKLNSSDLEVLLSGIQIVLGAVDPVAETATSNRWESALYGTERIYSRDLRRGVAETLAYLAYRGEDHDLAHGLTLKTWVRQVIQNLLRRANEDFTGQLWESLGDVFSLLAEAAPEVFMVETRRGIVDDGSLLKKLFTDSHTQSAQVISNTQVNFLFALEMLAWKSDYLGLSVEIMAILSELDVDGTSGNAPAKSLSKVFLPWLPQTDTPVDRQFEVIQGITERHPKAGWKLLLSLLPTSHAVGFPTSGPKFSGWKPEAVNAPTLGEYIEITTEFLNRAMEIADAKKGHWVKLVAQLGSFVPAQRESLMVNLESYRAGAIDEAERFEIYEELSGLVRKHREFPDAKWSLDEEELQELSRIATTFESESIELKSKWLFNEQRPDLGIPFADDDAPYQERLVSLRKEACLSIFEQSGLPGITDFAKQVQYSYFVGRSLGSIKSRIVFKEIVGLLDSDLYPLVNFSVGYLDELVSNGGEVMDLLTDFHDRSLVLARLLSRLSDLLKAWQTAKDLGSEVDKLYWQEFQVAGRGEDFIYVNQVARQLLDHHLVSKAVELLSLYAGRGTNKIDSVLIVEALEAFAVSENLSEERSNHVSWTLSHLIDHLVKEGIDGFQVATLEWKLLPALGYGYKPSSIENLLASNPEFFITMLSYVYRPDDDSEAQSVDPFASRKAFQALYEWNQVPGSAAAGLPVDGERLKTWVARVRELAGEVHRSDAAESVIGQILAHSIPDEDGSWPATPIRDVIQSSPGEELGDGFVMGTRNLRGIYSRSMEEGGRQEHELAEKYENWKSRVADRWPIVASLLERVAESYRIEARREDERSRLWQEGLDG